jgi:uncharacterized iron-regulated protein
MKRNLCTRIGIVAVILFGVNFLTTSLSSEGRYLFDISRNIEVTLRDLVRALENNRIVLVGEHHTNVEHHRKQLDVIDAFHGAGLKVAVAMEMFRSDSQENLNRWVAGKLTESTFKKIYYDNWNYDWSLYAPILRYARENQLPVLGLNVSRRITSQVARHGFKSLTEEQRGKLKDITCRVDEVYMDFIRRAYGAHAHGNLDFEYFCESQLVWDNIMAINTLNFLQKHPDHVVIIIAGNGHVWKGGIPTQLKNRSFSAYTVILPEVPGAVEKQTLSLRDADYIFLD